MEEESFCLQTKIDNTTTGTEFDCAEIFIKLLKEDQRNMRIQTANSKSQTVWLPRSNEQGNRDTVQSK